MRGRDRGGFKKERLPKDPAKASEVLNEQLMKFQAKKGINVDVFKN